MSVTVLDQADDGKARPAGFHGLQQRNPMRGVLEIDQGHVDLPNAALDWLVRVRRTGHLA